MIELIDIASVLVRDRQRSRMDSTKLKELRWSIEANGLLQPPGVWIDDLGIPHLVWGERRFRTIEALAKDGKQLKFMGAVLPLGKLPVLVFDPAAPLSTRKTAEFTENTEREDLSWQDRTKAYAEIHELRKLENPEQTVIATARELEASGGIDNAKTVRGLRHQLTISTALAPHLNDPEISKARTATDAYQILAKRMEGQALAALGRQTMALATGPLIEVIHADCIKWMKEAKPKQFDLILTDPPYGMGADTPNFSRRQAQPHIYKDTPLDTRELLQVLLLEGFRLAKDRANLFIFCDMDNFIWLREAAERAAWTPFRTPIVWDKETPGIGPWHSEGFQRSYELIFFATKGQRGLLRPVRDVREHRRVPTEQRVHPAQKPAALLSELIELSTMPGDNILDPFAGSGSTLIAAKRLHRAAVGIEREPGYIDNIQGALAEMDLAPASPTEEIEL